MGQGQMGRGGEEIQAGGAASQVCCSCGKNIREAFKTQETHSFPHLPVASFFKNIFLLFPGQGSCAVLFACFWPFADTSSQSSPWPAGKFKSPPTIHLPAPTCSRIYWYFDLSIDAVFSERRKQKLGLSPPQKLNCKRNRKGGVAWG